MAQMQHQILLAHLVPAVIKFLANKQRWLQCYAEVFLPNIGCLSRTPWYRVLYVEWLHLPLNKLPLLDVAVNVDAIQMLTPMVGISKRGKNSGQSNH